MNVNMRLLKAVDFVVGVDIVDVIVVVVVHVVVVTLLVVNGHNIFSCDQ